MSSDSSSSSEDDDCHHVHGAAMHLNQNAVAQGKVHRVRRCSLNGTIYNIMPQPSPCCGATAGLSWLQWVASAAPRRRVLFVLLLPSPPRTHTPVQRGKLQSRRDGIGATQCTAATPSLGLLVRIRDLSAAHSLCDGRAHLLRARFHVHWDRLAVELELQHVVRIRLRTMHRRRRGFKPLGRPEMALRGQQQGARAPSGGSVCQWSHRARQAHQVQAVRGVLGRPCVKQVELELDKHGEAHAILARALELQRRVVQ